MRRIDHYLTYLQYEAIQKQFLHNITISDSNTELDQQLEDDKLLHLMMLVP